MLYAFDILLFFLLAVSWGKMILQGIMNDEYLWLFKDCKAFESDSILYRGQDWKGS